MALEKPFINSGKAEGTPDPVNFNDILSFRKTNQNGLGVAKPKFHIEFSRDENSSSPATIIWKYKEECVRNIEYQKIISMISTKI